MDKNLNAAEKNDLVDFIIQNNFQKEFESFLQRKQKQGSELNKPEDKPTNLKISEKEQKRLNRINFNLKKNFAFKFAYNGKNYEGLVLQKHTTNTVEEKILSSLKKAMLIEDYDNCNYSRCGRTDAGVSAVGNVFSLTLRYKPNMDYVKTINNMLPEDIRILASAEVDEFFDARFSCLYREYNYFFLKGELNIDLMRKAAQSLVGVHNFKNFCKIDRNEKEDKNFE